MDNGGQQQPGTPYLKWEHKIGCSASAARALCRDVWGGMTSKLNIVVVLQFLNQHFTAFVELYQFTGVVRKTGTCILTF